MDLDIFNDRSVNFCLGDYFSRSASQPSVQSLAEFDMQNRGLSMTTVRFG